ncbi:MAG: AMP-binding protein [Alistipes sp.]|nr:AMP-binding protein [Alistipes sp.]
MGMLIRDIVEESEKKFSDIAAVKWLNKKEILERSYSGLMANVMAVRKGLLAQGFQGKHIALIGTSSVEWIESYLGIVTGNTVAVPLDAGLPGEDLIDLINRSDAEALFLSPKCMALLEGIQAECPKLRKIWILQEEDTEIPNEKTASMAELKSSGKENDADSDRPQPEDIATIIFTSGTTGKSKGVMLTQNNLAANVIAVDYTREPGTVMLSVLPIHHAFCLVMDWLKGFSLGATVCINDSLLHMVKNMGVFKPDVMLMVPLMLETIYKKLSAAGPLIPKKVIAAKVFGGNLKIIFTGGAHLDPFYIEKFAEYGVEVLEGYGMSECSPVISCNLPKDHKAGSIGRPLSNVELSFEDGEILVKGSSVMKGYYHMPEETNETLRDGWLHTGDKGYLDEDGFLFINGRIKNLIILSNGENISPEEIENKLALGKLVGEVIVTGENNGLTARIYPDQDVVSTKHMSEEKIRTELQAFLDKYNKNQPSYRKITGLVVRQNPFIRSATKKIKRQEALIDEPLPTK